MPIAMAEISLYDQLESLKGQVRRSIDKIDDAYPLKRWFAIELETFGRAGPRESASLEDVSARMRAIRQLEFMVQECLRSEDAQFDPMESIYTQMARVPASLLEAVQQTNFSIEPSLLLKPAAPVRLFDLVSPTAKVVSFLRSRDPALSFASRLSCSTEAQAILQELGIVDDDVRAKLSSLFLLRYYCINAVVAGHNAHQVLEIAAGISPRGLHWSRERPGTVFIESDLPALMREKSKALRDSVLEDDVTRRGVLHCCGLDALDLAGFQHALEYTDPRSRLVIVTEGLLLYFSADEMQRFFQNMQTILEQNPRAVWVVDMISRQNLAELCDADSSVAAAVKSVFASTQREVISANPFHDESEIRDALHASGLQVVSQSRLSDGLRNGVRLPEPFAAEGARICGNRKIWTISAS